MALSLKWDTAFESRPPAGLNRNQLDNELRLMRDMTRQAMFQEHNFGPGTADDGKHRPGQVTLFDVGNITNRDSLTDVPDGALYLLDKGFDNYELQGYHSATDTWKILAYPDHSQLNNLLDVNAHPEFLLKSGGTLSRPVDALNAGVHIPGAGVSKYGYLTSEHFNAGHPNTVRDTITPMTNGTLLSGKLKKHQIVLTASFSSGDPMMPTITSDQTSPGILSTYVTPTITGDYVPPFGNWFFHITNMNFSGGITSRSGTPDAITATASSFASPVFVKDALATNQDVCCIIHPWKIPVNDGYSLHCFILYTAYSPWNITFNVTMNIDVYGSP